MNERSRITQEFTERTMTEFRLFFQQATGFEPFAYQEQLAHAVPDLLTVPTGTGKTAAAVLSWAWRRTHAGAQVRQQTARRLVFCLPMRTLVEQTVQVSEQWFAKLGLNIEVHTLMGGAVDQSWDGDFARDAMLVGTQDQLLSRALNRGYAMSRYRWPVHFGALHNDVLWVIDETQLMGVGLSTTAQLHAFRKTLGVHGTARSLWMSATNSISRLQTVDMVDQDLSVLQLADADRAHPVLNKRLNARKGLAELVVDAKGREKQIASRALSQHRLGTKTLVVMNQVKRAQDVYSAIKRSKEYRALLKQKQAPEIALIHSRFRPVDRSAMSRALNPEWSGILVATQAIEAGIDLSARLLVTEVASWSSLIQRFGRCNRAGEYELAEVLWVRVPGKKGAVLPYTEQELSEAMEHLSSLQDVGPESLLTRPIQHGPPILPVIRRGDLLQLFHTETDLSGADTDVSPYIREADDRAVQLAWRVLGDKAPDPQTARADRKELVRAPVGQASKLVQTGSWAYRWDGLSGGWERTRRLIPGQIYLLDVDVGGYQAELGFTGAKKDKATVEASTMRPPDSDVSDPLTTQHGAFVTLQEHSEAVAHAMVDAIESLQGTGLPQAELSTAARWHDAGKSHPEFQKMLLRGLPEGDARRDGTLWAKSDGVRRKTQGPNDRPRAHLRHEVASALAWLRHGDVPGCELDADLVAYLIAAHHGKVRMSLRALPGERPTRSDLRISRGVQDGDVLPVTALGSTTIVPETRLLLDVVELGGAGVTRSWTERTEALLQRYGPFRLAYLEALVRTCDWRASSLHREQAALEVHHD